MCKRRDLVTKCAKSGIWLPNVQKTGFGYQMSNYRDLVTKCANIRLWLPKVQISGFGDQMCKNWELVTMREMVWFAVVKLSQ